MSNTRSTVRIVGVSQKNEKLSFQPRQTPISIDENFTIKVQLVEKNFDRSSCRNFSRKSQIYTSFIESYRKLTTEELRDGLCIPISQIKDTVLHNVPCIGCRSSIDNFIKLLVEHRHAGLEPFYLDENGCLTVKHSFSSDPDAIFSLFHVDGNKVQSLIENLPKSKKNRRCQFHSLDKSKSIHDWQYVWDAMNQQCHEEITLVEADGLLETIENYLRKHKFCSECKLKVLEAYDILMDFPSEKQNERRGFCPNLYEGLRSCSNEKHVHVEPKRSFINSLISRAEPDIEEGRRERHAKTLDVAQEEILTCLGIYLFDRFDKIHRAVRSEEQISLLLFYICVDCLKLNFEKTVDRKKDFSATLELLCEEFRVADLQKEQKKQQKRSKRRARRQTKSNDLKNQSADKISDENEKEKKFVGRRRSSSCCSCLCHFRDKRSNSLSIIQTTARTKSLVKSHSCPTSLLIVNDSSFKSYPNSQNVKNQQILRLSSSLETLFSSISNKECVCYERNQEKQPVPSCEECPSSSSNSCIRCSSTRTDLGYSSGQDETGSFGPCECLTVSCNACLTAPTNCCPLHEEDENSDENGASISPSNSMLSSALCSRECCVHDTFLDQLPVVELFDRTRKHKLKLQLSKQYPYFNMLLKDIWDEENSGDSEDRSFISDEDLRQFSKLNKNVDSNRIKVRERVKRQFQAWKEKSSRLSMNN